MKMLPLGIQTFSKIINENFIYVDKTENLYNLIKTGNYYFISRPRRFGKSLTCSTLKEIFSGNKELFRNLWIYNSDYDWQKYPVIHMSFASVAKISSDDFKKSLKFDLGLIAKQYQINITGIELVSDIFKYLVIELSKHNKVVLIIDEYDKPILEHITDKFMAEEMREVLSGFYGVIKDLDPYLKFVFLTGVTKFSKTSIFSKLNNLEDISLSYDFSSMIGYTQKELEFYFQEYIKKICVLEKLEEPILLEKIKTWYNGYKFNYKATTMYNPFSILNFFKQKSFENFWFASGTPTFLIDLIKKNNYPIPEIENAALSQMDLESFEVDNIKLISLLYQTGYLSIDSFNKESRNYYLKYPNEEIRVSLNLYIFESMANLKSTKTNDFLAKFRQALNTDNINLFFQIFYQFLTQIPHTIHEKELLREKYFQNIFFIILSMLGAKIRVEEATNIGYIDATLQTDKSIFIIEFKFNKSSEEAIKQIRDKKYYEKYLPINKNIILIGVNFDSELRNITSDWIIESIPHLI